MGRLVTERNIYRAIDEIDMSNHDKAAAKAWMREAEIIADCIWSAGNGLSRLGRAVAKLVHGGKAPASRQVH